VHSTHAYSESQNLLRRVVNEQVTEGKNSAHVANQSSLDRRSFADYKSTGGLRATKWYSEAHTGPSVFEIRRFMSLTRSQQQWLLNTSKYHLKINLS
jgi:hypothetical protein